MSKDYLQTKRFETGPIVENNEVIGHFFNEYKEGFYLNDDEITISSSDWSIFQNGEYTCNIHRARYSGPDGEDKDVVYSVDDLQEGVFDSSRFEEYVEQMMNNKTDWKKGLIRIPWKKKGYPGIMN